MSSLKLDNIQVGRDSDPTKNFHFRTVAANDFRLSSGNIGSPVNDLMKLTNTDVTLLNPKAIATPPQFDNSKLLATTEWAAKKAFFKSSDSPNVTPGVLIKTNIDYSGVAGNAVRTTIKQYGYYQFHPREIVIETYLWNNEITPYCCASSKCGGIIPDLRVFVLSGKLCFWFKHDVGYWEKIEAYSELMSGVGLSVSDALSLPENNVVSITFEAMPTTNLRVGSTVNSLVPWYEKSGAVVSFNGNGYQRLPSGLILQWGKISTVSGADSQAMDITFPIVFPTAPLSVIGSVGIAIQDYDSNSGYRQQTTNISIGHPTQTGCECQIFIQTGTSGNGRVFQWFATGY